jgi:GNAT superfamily N-acetyltransferase
VPLELQRGEFTLSDDPLRLDAGVVFDFLSRTYWAKSRPRALVEKSIRNSLCVGVYRGSEQVGFARAITDRATFAYLADVFVLAPFRRRGLAKWMVATLLDHPELQGLRRWCLVTQDAHDVYRAFGFQMPEHPDRYMELLRPYPQSHTP